MKMYSKGLSLLLKSILSLLFFTSSTLVFAEENNTEENFIINGSFEQHGDLNRGSWGTFKSIEGWKANRGLLEVQHNNVSGIAPVDGIAKIELDSHYNSRIFQKLNNLVEGETYRLSLNYSPRTTHKNSNKIRVKWNSEKLAILNGREQGWTQHSFDVVAKAKNRLKFHAIGRSDSYGGLLDDVSLVCVTCDDTPPPVTTSTVNTRITTPNGEAVSNTSIIATSVSDGTSTTFTSGTTGKANLELVAGQEYVLKLDKAGYATQVTPVKAPSIGGVINLNITMIERGIVQSFVAEDGATLSGDNGAEVTIDPNSFVDANGIPVTGIIEVTITPVDVSNANSLAAFPGDFTGTTDTGNTPIISFGTVEYIFTQNGNPLQLAPGATADILIPIYFDTYQNGFPIGVRDEIPLWSLNEETGIWLQEGTGTVVASDDSPTGLAMEATVSHFTWWNCDVSMNAAQVIVTVTGSQAGTALIKATTNADIGFRSPNVDTVAEIGVATSPLYIPSDALVCFSADINYADGTSGTSQEVCETAAPDSLINITLNTSEPGPVNIVGNGAEGPLTVNGFVDYSFEKIRLFPTTTETSVTYSILSGTLPFGVSLNTINDTSAEIVGSSAIEGSYSVVIQGVDSDSTSDTVTINFNISSDVPPPELNSFINLETISFNFNGTFDLNDYNSGGLATNWELRWNYQFEQEPPPAEITLDPNTGILTLSSCTGQGGYNVYWYGIAFAENASGSAEQDIRVYCSPGNVD